MGGEVVLLVVGVLRLQVRLLVLVDFGKIDADPGKLLSTRKGTLLRWESVARQQSSAGV